MKKSLVITVGTGTGKNEDATKSIAHGIAASIKNSHPNFIVFVVTQESEEKTIPEIKKQLPDLQPYELISIKNMNNVNEVFEKVSNKVRDLRKEGHEVVIDFTSGTKAMSAGAVLAATSEAVMISNVAGERVEGKVPIGGEQVLVYSPVKGMISMQEKIIKELFNSYQFDAALRILDGLFEITAEASTVERLKKSRSIVEGYSLWDRFNHSKSQELLSGIDEAPPRNKEFLGKLSSSGEGEPFYIADLLNNAERRFKEGKYDDAVARLYRTVELIAQYRLKKEFGIDSSNVELDKIHVYLENKYEKMRDEKGKIKLGLNRDYELLNDMDDELGKKFSENKKLQNLLKKRNESILAHGLTSVSKETYEELYPIVLEFAKIVIQNIEKLMENSKFPKYEDLTQCAPTKMLE